jgi:phosphoglycolate phosphatase
VADAPPARIAVVVFDLDGTLVDSRRDLADSANQLIDEHGGRPLDQPAIVSMVGEGVELLVRRAMAAAGIAPVPPGAVARFTQIYGGRLLAHTRPYAGVPEALAAARPLARLAVLSNKPRAASRQILEGLGLAGLFDEVCGGDEAFPRKPDPAGLLGIVERLGASAGSALLVGDSPIDLRTARAAGTRVCLARYGFGFARIAADLLDGREHVIDDPRELIPLLRAANGATANRVRS